MFTDSSSLKKAICCDKVSAIRKLVLYLFVRHAKTITSPEEMPVFSYYVESIFNYILENYGIHKDDLCIDMDDIMSYTCLGKDK